MIKDSFKALGSSARALFRNWTGLALLNALYAALLVSLYIFFATGVASAWQLTLSAATALAAPLIFFLLHTAIAHFALGDAPLGPLARRTLRDFLKVVLFSLPLITLAVGIVYLLGKFQSYLPKPDDAAPHTFTHATLEPRPEPLHWQDTLVSTLWLLLLGVLLPLLAAHLWLSTARDGLLPTLKKIHRVAARAFATQSILIYAVGLFVFALIPYFTLYTRTPVSNGWAELFLFATRLALAFIFTLWGWTITLGALARTTPPLNAVVETTPATGAPPVADAPPVVEAAPVTESEAQLQQT